MSFLVSKDKNGVKWNVRSMSEDKIIIKPYNDRWPSLFEQERDRLQPLIKPWLEGSIEHVGSTAVVGLSAKPVIDIMIGVKSLAASHSAISVLVEHGYYYYPYKANVMHWFCKPTPEIRTHHLHLIPFNSPLWRERIRFRDILRNNAELVAEYQALKVNLSVKYKDDRELYTQHKWPFISRVLASHFI